MSDSSSLRHFLLGLDTTADEPREMLYKMEALEEEERVEIEKTTKVFVTEGNVVMVTY